MLHCEVPDSQEQSSMIPGVALRLASTAGDLPQLEQALSGYGQPRPAERTTLRSTYYDTDAGALRQGGLVLRVREENGQYTQIVDRTGVEGKSPRECREWQDIIYREGPDLQAQNSGAHLPQTFSEAELRPLFTTVLQRTLFILEPDASTQIAGAVDNGEIRTIGGERSKSICEVNLQLQRGDPDALYKTGLYLLEIAPLRIELCGKAEHGYRLLDSATAKPQVQHAPLFSLKSEMTVEESLREIGVGCLTLFLRNERAALADVSDGVHEMRVAVRRLRDHEADFAARPI
jgi:inorganic triphosphatase YgiF